MSLNLDLVRRFLNEPNIGFANALEELKRVQKEDERDMIERGIDTDDFIDEQISIEGHSIQDLIDYVQGELDNHTGGKRKMRKMRKSRKITRKRRTRKHRRRRTRRYH